MADNREDFEVWLKSRYDGDAMKAAQADFKRTQDAAKKTDESFKDMGYSADALKQQLTGLLAFTAVVAQFREGFEQVAALEQAMNQLERAAKRNGDNFDVVKGKIVGMADALKKAAGVDDDAAIKKMVSLYNATGDVANAMNLVALAADVAVGSGIEFQQASDLVTKAATGEVGELKRLGITIDENGTKTEKATRGLDALQKTFGGAANGAKGLKVEIDRLNESYEDLRNSAVETTTPILTRWLAFAKSWGAALAGVADITGEVVHGVFLMFMKSGDALGQLLKGNVSGAKAIMREAKRDSDDMFDAIVQSAKQTADKVRGLWSGEQQGGAVNAGKPTPLSGGGGGGAGEADEERFAVMFGPSVDLFRKYNADIAKEQAKEDARRRERYANFLQEQARWLDKRRDAVEAEAEEEAKIAKRNAEKLAEIERERQAAAIQGMLQAASIAAGVARDAFGESKGLAIADATINTIAASLRAYKDYPYPANIAVMIATIAAGMAQVAKIQSTNPDATRGQGFDNPNSDAAARLGGRRWAADMIGEFTGGVREGWAAGMMGSARGGNTTNYDQRRTYNVHLHGAGLIDPSNQQMLLQLKRNLDMVGSRVDSQRTLARAAR